MNWKLSNYYYKWLLNKLWSQKSHNDSEPQDINNLKKQHEFGDKLKRHSQLEHVNPPTVREQHSFVYMKADNPRKQVSVGKWIKMPFHN